MFSNYSTLFKLRNQNHLDNSQPLKIRDIMKHEINNIMYGDEWRQPKWREMYAATIANACASQTKHQKPSAIVNGFYHISRHLKGGATDEEIENEIGFKIKDTFIQYDTNSMLFGKTITRYAKKIIFEVIKFYNESATPGGSEQRQQIIKYLKKVFEKKDLNYDKLVEKFNAKTNEALLAYMLLAYQNDNLDLMLRTTYTFGRVLPLNYKNEWFDNYRLNAYGNVLNLTMWNKWDANDIFSVDYDPEPINRSVRLSSYGRTLKYLVGSLRAFIVIHKLWPDGMGGASITGGCKEDEPGYAKLFGGMSDEATCDEAYEHFPFYFGGAHGCDVFDMPSISLNLDEITEFLNRYPSARVGYILNTATYASQNGEHWVALELTKGKARMICSQQGDFTSFHDGGKLRNKLRELGYGEEWNNREIQTENYGCGTYAFISLMELLRFDDIDKAVDAIGVNMEKLGKEVGKESNVDIVREKLVGFKNE